MSRLTKKCGDWGYTVPGLNSVVKDNVEIIGEMTNKLAEYENLGSVEEIVQKIHELEVYKRALKSSCDELEKKYMFAQDETTRKIMPLYEYFLDQARKERKMSKSLSEDIHFALCCISECCVDESKRNITSRKAVEKIREYLSVITDDDRYSKNFNISLKREILQKDQRIAELEKENEEKEDKILDLKSYNSDLKETISKLSFSAVRCQAINDEVCQYILDNELLKKENAELKSELEELKKNAIVPKFKLWQEIWYVAKKFGNTTFLGYEILKGVIFSYVSNQSTLIIEYKDKKVPIVDNEFIFAAEQEAEEALKKLEEK